MIYFHCLYAYTGTKCKTFIVTNEKLSKILCIYCTETLHGYECANQTILRENGMSSLISYKFEDKYEHKVLRRYLSCFIFILNKCLVYISSFILINIYSYLLHVHIKEMPRMIIIALIYVD